MLFPRLLVLILSIVGLALFSKIALCCHRRNQPITGCRKSCLICIWTTFLKIMGFFAWFMHVSYDFVTPEEVNYYEEYLGAK